LTIVAAARAARNTKMWLSFFMTWFSGRCVLLAILNWDFSLALPGDLGLTYRVRYLHYASTCTGYASMHGGSVRWDTENAGGGLSCAYLCIGSILCRLSTHAASCFSLACLAAIRSQRCFALSMSCFQLSST
jgi:hypothetical protein